MTRSIAWQAVPQAVLRMAAAAFLAAVLAFAANVQQARANNWVGPAIVGALIGGAIVHHAHAHDRHRHYGHRHYRKHSRHHRRHYHGAPVPAIVIPIPFVGMYHGW